MSDKIKELLAKDSFDINDLADIVVILRSENGCPWDKVQTHKSIKKDFLEEVYEVMEAIDCDSPEMMREELGFCRWFSIQLSRPKTTISDLTM